MSGLSGERRLIVAEKLFGSFRMVLGVNAVVGNDSISTLIPWLRKPWIRAKRIRGIGRQDKPDRFVYNTSHLKAQGRALRRASGP